MTSPSSTLENVTCLGCGCACDDIHVTTRDNRIVEARNACELGVAWFGDGQVPTETRVAGREASLQDAINAAATLLASAARPLVYLAPDLSCEAQRELAAIADALGASLDSVTSSTALESVLASQERGRAGATLGELRHRADVVVFWGVDPSLRYPRYGTRYVPDVAGIHTPDGRRSRKVVAVDVIASGDAAGGRGPADADLRIAVPEADESSTLTALASLAAGRDTGGSEVAWTRARTLAGALINARYVAIVADAERGVSSDEWRVSAESVETRREVADAAGKDSGRAAALIALAESLNGPTRCALNLLRAGGNRSGADAVLTWQTGFPLAVDFARGHPRYRPYDGTAAVRLSRGEVDALLLAGSASLVPADLLALMARVPRVVIGPRASTTARSGHVRDVIIDTAVAGIHESGTALRMDDVPLPLRAAIAGPVHAAEIASALGRRVREFAHGGRRAGAR